MKLSEWATSTAMVRMVLGLAQGFALYFVTRALDQTAAGDGFPYVLGILLPLVAYVPVIAMLEVDRMSARRLNIWLATLVLLLAGLAMHDFWRRTGTTIQSYGFFNKANTPSLTLMISLVPFLFIANALFAASSQDKRPIATYGSYFDVAWKQGVQLVFAVAFVGVMWAALWLGATLFGILKLDFFRDLILKPWFRWPVSYMALGMALHLTDVAPGIIAGIRRLALVLLSWLLPLMVLIILGFLGALAATSLDLLWQTKRGALVLLIAAAWLVVLANCAYQQGPPRDGQDGHIPAKILAWAGSLVGPILMVLVALAAYAAHLRVAQYGWTDDRVLLAATIVVAGLYAVGYTVAGWWNGQPRRRWEGTNVVVSFAILAIVVALMTPLADPARIAVGSQLARLDRGEVDATTFDFRSLRFDGARYGVEALRRLAESGPSELAETAQASLNARDRLQSLQKIPEVTTAQVAANLSVAYPPDTPVPAGLATPNLAQIPCLRLADKKCDVILLGKSAGGQKMAALLEAQSLFRTVFLFIETAPQHWTYAGSYPSLCLSHYKALLRGEFKLTAPLQPDLSIGDRRYPLTEVTGPAACPP